MPRAAAVVLLVVGWSVQVAAAEGDPEEGARAFRPCAACHTLKSGEHRTGPSLADVFGRQAGTAPGFTRYSPALQQADVVWDAAALDAWLADPQALIPGNRMSFPGIPDAAARADLVAYLEAATAQAGAAPPPDPSGRMAAGEMTDLRHEIGPNNRIRTIRHCGDTYTVTVENGAEHQFWEFNLRFKTDSSARGPEPAHPVLIPASMMGDRAFVIFAAPAEISPFIEAQC
ncbi:MAG TPA: c-type cytochrome [Geminicoccaceae bacterium]|nr:c-type cytochrome [Geminicoccaceae bacterium]